jgi:hypothetical protein
VGYTCYFKVKHHVGGVTNLVIVDLLEGLHVPSFFIPSNFVPPWNETNPHFLNVLFSFYNFFLHDDGAFLIFYLDDISVLRDILRYLPSNNFKIHKIMICCQYWIQAPKSLGSF